MINKKNILITGGAGFIGSALVRNIIQKTEHSVINVDKLTYSGNLQSLESIEESKNYTFEQVDICDEKELHRVFKENQPDIVIHLAAESHVDRSIDSPRDFIQTNIFGTFILLEQSRNYWQSLEGNKKENFRFLYVSTDEVYGDLSGTSSFFTEESNYRPSSPYSASKASSDHLVRAWYRTYGLPILITNCSNNYGPYQFPEKLLPLMIQKALEGEPLPVYGDGKQVRDWLYVEDHCRAILEVLEKGEVGQVYNIGGHNEKTNMEVVHALCKILDEMVSDSPYRPHKNLIQHVTDRPGHDRRYAIDASKIQNHLGWKPQESFETGLQKTVRWYLDNKDWTERVQSGAYRGERLGLEKP